MLAFRRDGEVIFFPAIVTFLSPGWAVMSSGVMEVNSTVTTELLLAWSHALLLCEVDYGIRNIGSRFRTYAR